MIDALFSQPNYVATKKLLDVTVLRHSAIASNLANVETPQYKRIDIAPAFESQLRQAVKSRDPVQVAGLQPHLAVDTQAVSTRRDGNTVQMESEMVRLSQNTVEHALETQLISASLLRLRLAISGRNS